MKEKIKKIILITIISILFFNTGMPIVAVMAEDEIDPLEKIDKDVYEDDYIEEYDEEIDRYEKVYDEEVTEYKEDYDEEMTEYEEDYDEETYEYEEIYDEEIEEVFDDEYEEIIEGGTISYDNFYELNEEIHLEGNIEPEVIEEVNTYSARTYRKSASRGLNLKDYIINEAKSGSMVINISSYNVLFDNMKTVLVPIISSEEMFFVSSISWNGRYIYNADKTKRAIGYEVILTTTMNEEKIVEMWNSIDAETSNYLNGIKPEWNDLEKLIYTSNYLCKKCEYSDINGMNSHTIVGALVDGKVVCDGYAKALKYLLKQVGVSSTLVTSDEMDHAWNLVKIAGSYYHVDLTWNDEKGYGKTGYEYFLVSDSGLDSHYGWVADYRATSIRYDNANWKKVTNYLAYNNNYWYYANLGANKDTINLNKIDFRNYMNTAEQKVIKVDKSVCEPGLTTDGNSLYFTTRYSIWKMNFDGSNMKKIYSILDTKKSLYSIEFVENKLYYEVVDVIKRNEEEKINVYSRVANVCEFNSKPVYTLLPVEKVSLKNIIKFNTETKISSILNEEKFPALNEYEVIIIDATGNKKQITENVGSKNVIQIKDKEGNIAESYTTIVKGDITGNGQASIEDIFQMLSDSILDDVLYDEMDIEIRDYDGNNEVKMYDAFNFLKEKNI